MRDLQSDYSRLYVDRAVAARSLRGKGIIQLEPKGSGAALVGIRDQRPERADEMRFYPKRGLHVSATLVMKQLQETGIGADKRTLVELTLVAPPRTRIHPP